jgi:hypothetical protein
MIPVFERAKAVHAVYRAAAVIGDYMYLVVNIRTGIPFSDYIALYRMRCLIHDETSYSQQFLGVVLGEIRLVIALAI